MLKNIFRIFKHICVGFFLLFPVKKNTALFLSFSGQYNDHAKPISIVLHRLYPEIRQIWVSSSKSHEQFPKYAKTVKYNSINFCMYSARAQVVVDNNFGTRAGLFRTNSFLIRWYRWMFCRTRKLQYNISIWHGTPLKKIGCDEPDSKFVSGGTSSDLMVTGSQYAQNCFFSAFPYRVPIKLYGTPRNDILFNKNVDMTSIKERLHLPQDKKIILFAPTFRNDLVSSGVMQMHTINFEQLFSALKKKFTGSWCFVFRVHQRVLLEIDSSSFAQGYGQQIVDGNIGDDMAEYLVCADILLTDYSGSMFDFALTKRPCFLFTPDREHYENSERGFYMDFSELPFPKAYTSAELIKQIDDFDVETYGKKIDQFLTKIGNVEDGHATERIVDDIHHFLSTGEKKI